ncbi:MAG: regulatory protein RecX [Prevotella sp.]|jgi:regulatory protein|nr:regulatory protein RecX [Prevotella sp.]
MQKKTITEQEALVKLSGLCVKAEHSSGEMLQKMRLWQMADDARERVLRQLVDQQFVDDARFAKAFIADKIQYNGWGRRKIEQALRLKGVAESIYMPILDEVSDEEYLAQLRPLLKSKWKQIRANSDYERSGKLIKFAMSRGYTLDIIRQCIDSAVEADWE